MLHGIDVSSFQSDTYATAGLSFVVVKATESTTYVNPKHSAQVAHGRNAGLVIGHYHFAHGGNPIAEADYFLAHAGLKPGDFIAYDWENSAATQADRDAWIKHVKAKAPGHRVILYCNVDYWTKRDTESNAGDGLWIADPNHSAGKPGIRHSWLFHQYSSAGGLDRNVANFSSLSALKAWAGVAAPAKPPAKPPVTPPAKPPVTPPAKPPVTDPLAGVHASLAALQRDLTALTAAVAALKGRV
jgi:hypothetical protein